MQLEKYNDDCAMNLPFAIKMREKIDAERLENALNRVIAENDVLRVVACHRKSVAAEDECFDNLEGIFMSSGSDDGGTEGIRVRFLKEYHYSLTVREVEGKTYVERVRNALQTVNSDIRTRMDIESNIPARLKVYRVDENEYWIVFYMQHYVCDPPTLAMYMRAVFGYYLNPDAPQIFGTEASYMDYLSETENFENTAEGYRAQEFWEKEYSDYSPVVLERKTAADREEMPKGFLFDRDRLSVIAKNYHTSIFNVVMLIFHLAYCRIYSEDTSVSFAVNGRREKKYQTVMGCFTEVVSSRLKIEREMTFTELHSALRRSISKATEHSSPHLNYNSPFIISYQDRRGLTGNGSLPESPELDLSYLLPPGIAFTLAEIDDTVEGSAVMDTGYYSGRDVRDIVDVCMQIQDMLPESRDGMTAGELLDRITVPDGIAVESIEI